jgi:hypothetical protein
MKRAVYCVICKEEVDLSRGITLDHACGCYSHAGCHGADDMDPQCALHNPQSAAAKLAVPLAEPRYPGLDWVAQGYTEPTARQKMSKLTAMGETPFTLLKSKVDLADVIRQKKWGLGHLYGDWGVRLEDFLRCGYSLDELETFEDMRKRPLQTLKTLGLNADLLLDYSDLLPADELRKRYGMKVEDIGESLRFDPKRGLCTPKSDNWGLDNLIYLGYKWNDIVAYLGLKNADHWDELEPTTEHLKQLGCTQEQVERHFDDVSPAPPPAAAVPVTRNTATTMPRNTTPAPPPRLKNRILK